MSFRFTYVTVLLCAATSLAMAQYHYTPTTTIAAEQGINSSATSAWMTTFQPTATSQNVSKQPTRSLLYSGANTKVYAALMLWWGKSSHINVGYSSQDPAQVTRQVDDMVSRGIDGAIMAWYGKDSYENSGAIVVMQEAQKRTNFKFAIMIDQGAIQWDSCTGCDPTQALIAHLNYLNTTYYPSPAYLTIGGRPAVIMFGLEKYTIDWNLVRSSVNGNPLFIFRNPSGFTATQSDGAYGWIEPTQDTATDPYDLAYLDAFYSKSLTYLSTKAVFGSAYPGFNDQLASWGTNRVLTYDCGQTWLATFAEAGKYYSSSKQLPNIQLVTWNDYEEGTAMEGGIDNCVSVASSLSGNILSWTPTGKENTLTDYTVFVSQDESSAAVLTTVPVSTHSLDLSTFNFPAGTWYFYVRATAKSTLQNHFAPPVSLTIVPPPPPASADFTIATNPSSVSVHNGQSTTTTVTVTQTGTLGAPVVFSCMNLPAKLSCSFAPSSIAAGTPSATSTLTITARANAAALTPPSRNGGGIALAAALLLPAFLLVRRRALRAKFVLLTMVVCFCALGLTACGGTMQASNLTSSTTSTTASNSTSSTTTYVITVVGTSGTTQHSVQQTVVVN